VNMTTTIRDMRIRFSGSPYYQIKPGVITAGAFSDYTYDSSSELVDAKKYAPLDYIEITNNDVVEIEIQINQKDKFYVAPSSIKRISNHPIHHIRVRNLHASTSTTADKIVLLLQKEPYTTDKFVRSLYGRNKR